MRVLLCFYLILFYVNLKAQTTVSGLVLNRSTNAPIELAEIVDDHNFVLAETDVNGYYSISIPEDYSDKLELLIRFTGYRPEKLSISDNIPTNLVTFLTPPERIDQTYQFKGRVIDEATQLPLEFATLFNQKTSANTTSGQEGLFDMSVTLPEYSTIRIDVNYLGYEESQYRITSDELNKEHIIYLKPLPEIIDEITVYASSFKDIIGVPVSLKTTSAALIQSNAGGGGDFTKLIQSLPGLTTINAFRNDLIVRGGSPSENSFFINDIEIPYINHLSTQGSTGGTLSILNSQVINEVDFIASGYPANRPDAMSGVFNIYLTDPFAKKEFAIGIDPTNVFLNGHTSFNKTAISFSLRKSYREFILKALGLAFVPNYSDFLFNVKQKLTKKSTLSFLAVGSIDDFTVNQNVNDSEIQQNLRDNLPTNQQSSLTTGLSYKNIQDKFIISANLSLSHFTNGAQKSNSIENQEVKILDYDSSEKRYRGQVEIYQDAGIVKLKYGGGFNLNQASYEVQNQFYALNGINTIDYVSDISYNLNHLFLQTTLTVVPSKFQVSMHNTFQFSNVRNQGMLTSLQYPRLNGKLSLIPSADFNFSIGEYSQLPRNILLAYQEESNYVNLENTEFIKSFQVTTGVEFLKENKQNQISIEGFWKFYHDYPFNTRDNISLANLGADFGVVGNVPINYSGEGRAYGMEIFFKRSNTKKLTGWISYALSKSEFLNAESSYVASSWDARHIVNAVFSYRLSDKWTIGLNAKYQSAIPYTPFDKSISSLVPVWDVNQIGIRDYSRVNSERGKSSTLIDLRFQRQYTWRNKSMKLYLDLENILADADSQQVLVLDRDESNLPVIGNPQDPRGSQFYNLKEIQNAEGVFIPSFGIEIKL